MINININKLIKIYNKIRPNFVGNYKYNLYLKNKTILKKINLLKKLKGYQYINKL